MKSSTIYLYFLLSTVVLACRFDCPDSYLFTEKEVPQWVKNDIDMYDVNTMDFLSDQGDTLHFVKDYSSRDELDRTRIKTVSCKEDRTESVDVFFDRTWNRVFFVSANNDSLGFQYYTKLASLGSFSYKNYDEVNNDDPYDMFANYRNVMFKFDGIYYSLTTLVHKKGHNVLKIYLNNDYEVLGINFSDVFYTKHPVLPVNVYFNDNIGIVGIEDLHGKKWIRLL